MSIPIQQVTGGGILGSAAIIGILVGFWQYIKIYLFKIFNIFIVNVELKDTAAKAMAIHLTNHFKCSFMGSKTYVGSSEFIRPVKRNQVVAYESIPTEPTIWWKGKMPLVVSGEPWQLKLMFIRFTYDRDTLIQNAIDEFNKDKSCKDWKTGDRFFVKKKYGSIGDKSKRSGGKQQGNGNDSMDEVAISAPSSDVNKYNSRPIKWKREELGQPKNEGAMNKLSLTDQADKSLHEAVLWRDSEEWFKERCIPWKRGWLLYGAPGTGKTAFTRALGQELNMPIFSLDLATMTNKDFSTAWSDMMGWSPCIALFEDFDGIFKGRENVAVTNGMENGLTFDGFLNCIDGVENTDGIFVIVTTNNVETLDPAIGNPLNGSGMSTRPGRIDRAIKFGLLDEAGRTKMAKRILDGFDESKWDYLYEEGVNDTGAQFQERCCRLALNMFWENK